MRTSVSAAVAALAILTLTSCSAPSTDVETPSPTSTTTATVELSTPTPTPTPTPKALVAPKECTDYVPSTPSDSSAVGLAGSTAVMPAGVVLNPGFQIIGSTDDPGRVEVVARICSDGVDRAKLIEAGNSIAQAIYADPSHDTVTLLMISSYVPTGDYLDKQPNLDTIKTDYELYLWDADEDSLASNWE